MHRFSDFKIEATPPTFTGDKIKVKNILNLEIKVLDFMIGPSKIKPGTECMTVQIEKGGDKRIIFTSSRVLMDQIKRVSKEQMPFTTTIKGDNDYYEFT